MHFSFVLISFITLDLFEYAVSNSVGNDQIPIFIHTIPPWLMNQSVTKNVEEQALDKEFKPVMRAQDTSPKNDFNVNSKQEESETETTPQEVVTTSPIESTKEDSRKGGNEVVINLPFRRRRSDDNNEKDDSPNKMKLKMKLDKTLAELKAKADAKKDLPKDVENQKETQQKFSKVPYLTKKNEKPKLPVITSKEERDNVKREQLLQWLYNARPLQSNETRLWAEIRSSKNKTSHDDHSPEPEVKKDEENKKKVETKREKDNKKSEENKRKADFQTVEVESKEKTKADSVPTKVSKTDKAVELNKETTVTTEKTTKDSDDLASRKDHDSNKDEKKLTVKKSKVESKEVGNKAKAESKRESDSDTTSDETIEEEKKETLQKKDNKRIIIHRFAPNDGPSSSESSSI